MAEAWTLALLLPPRSKLHHVGWVTANKLHAREGLRQLPRLLCTTEEDGSLSTTEAYWTSPPPPHRPPDQTIWLPPPPPPTLTQPWGHQGIWFKPPHQDRNEWCSDLKARRQSLEEPNVHTLDRGQVFGQRSIGGRLWSMSTWNRQVKGGGRAVASSIDYVPTQVNSTAPIPTLSGFHTLRAFHTLDHKTFTPPSPIRTLSHVTLMWSTGPSSTSLRHRSRGFVS